MGIRRAYPPEYDEEPPEDGLVTVEVAIGACRDCREIIGPMLSEDIGVIMYQKHEDHETEYIDMWEETEVLEEYFFEEE